VKRLTHIAGLTTILIVSGTLFARKRDPQHADHLCGVLDHVQHIPVRGFTRTYTEKRTPLPSLAIVFYQHQDGQNCCDGLKRIAATTTDKKGRFDLADVKYGQYWLSAEWNNKAYKYAFAYPFSKDADITCSLQGIDLEDDGSAQWWQTITLD
jgi:hypothetical protein